MLAGHNRQNAGRLAGLTEVPAIVKYDLTERDAYVYVIETNVMQRGFAELLPSETVSYTHLGDSEAGVFDGYEDLFASACDFYCYRGFILTEFNGVVHQVVKHLLDFTSVRVYKLYIRKQEKFDGYPLVRACAFK